MKLFCFLIVVSILCSATSLKSSNTEENQNEIEKLETQFTKDNVNKIKKKKFKPKKNVPILKLYGDQYWEGWIKYFKYDYDNTIQKPDNFYRNPHWIAQKTLVKDKDDQDLKGRPQHIPSPHHFWAKLLATGNLNILSNRKHDDSNMADSIENLNTDSIKYVHKSDNANGAIKDLGSLKEGHCISVSTLKPDNKKSQNFNPSTDDGFDQTWVICTDHKNEKNTLMSLLVSMKLRRQEDLGDILFEKQQSKMPYKTASELMKQSPFNPKIRRGGPKADDGYLLLLQDWSACSVKCGGGISTRQWMCVPPKNKGRPCPGETIQTRKCHKKPCPQVINSLHLPKNDKNHVTLTPKYVALPFSKRPQSYVQCEIKENDVLYNTNEFDPNRKQKVKVPARLVMNTHTISVFRDDGYNNALFVFNLAESSIALSEDDHCCFFVTNQNREHELCAFGNNCGTKHNPIWVNKWKYDFEYFLKKCHDPLQATNLKGLLKKHGPGKQHGPPGQGIAIDMQVKQQQMLKSKRSIIKKAVSSNFEVEMEKRVGLTQKVSFTALRREINLEDLIKKEEIEKGKNKLEELNTQVKQEIKKKQLLEKALMKRQQSYNQVRIAKHTKVQMDDIKNETKIDIKFKRSILKKKIEAIRNKFKRKHRLLQQKIQKIRSEMASSIMDANKNGNQELCIKARNDMAQIKKYCDENEAFDYIKNQSCKEPDNFCYRCCEMEFGNMFISKREDCQNTCDKEMKKDMENGDWIWTTD